MARMLLRDAAQTRREVPFTPLTGSRTGRPLRGNHEQGGIGVRSFEHRGYPHPAQPDEAPDAGRDIDAEELG